MRYYCPVCLYPDLPFAPKDHNICPSCGTEFGYDDASKSWADLREQWMNSGAKWFSDATPKPDGWDAYKQLFGSISLAVTATDDSLNEMPVREFAPPATIEP
jgi:hypothetical protein